MKNILPIALGGLVLALPVHAGGLRRENVAADATWLVHLDLARFQETELWNALRQLEEVDLHEVLVELDDVEQELGIDPLEELRSATVYGRGTPGEDPVVLVEASPSIDAALIALSQKGGYQQLERNGVRMFTFEDAPFFHVVSGPGERIVVLSETAEATLAAVQVLQGGAPSLMSDKTATLSVAPLPDSFLFFAGADVLSDFEDFEPASNVARLAQGVAVDVGESRGELFLRAHLRTPDVQSAMDLTDVVTGFVALGRMMMMGQEDVPDIAISALRALQVEARGNEVWIDFHFPVQKLVDELRDVREF